MDNYLIAMANCELFSMLIHKPHVEALNDTVATFYVAKYASNTITTLNYFSTRNTTLRTLDLNSKRNYIKTVLEQDRTHLTSL